MAEGLLHSKKEKGIEEVGEGYFQEFISKSYFQPSGENKSTFLMHDLIHELAMFVSGEFCSLLNENKLSHKVRHLSYMRDCGGIFYSKEFEEELSQAKCLRTFLLKLQWIELDRVWLSIIEQLHEAFPRLRVLSIANHYMNKLPDSIEEMPLQISKMKNLQTLNRFVVGENEFVITLLEGLQDLRGTLRLFGLENVDSVEDVLEAKLKNKKFLTQIHLFWAKTHKPHDSEREKEILSALEPHASLKAFTIRGYRGNSFPNWIGNHSNVVRVNLWHCETFSFLPPLGQLPSLKDLVIRGLYGVVKISSEFYYSTSVDSSLVTKTKPFRYLESLTFEDMRELQELSFIENGVFPCLKKLGFERCEKLQVNLKTLDEEAFQHLTSLEKLQIEYCGKLQYLPKELPSSLSDLCIRHCTMLEPRLEKNLGEDWPSIAHIPNINVVEY
ncbi:putative disease resistance RPP13-like protein 1 [Humulus lupulus]|uniref:putative disease resistance RPP13-like protein 1 n=1 Tax=Humulus lupulus TaxID=3486 RepID=UPI002B402148|nr:putative disease resistance RPP13-like protein 1 [Humulus lupulus]